MGRATALTICFCCLFFLHRGVQGLLAWSEPVRYLGNGEFHRFRPVITVIASELGRTPFPQLVLDRAAG
jgi:hypothetical protein